MYVQVHRVQRITLLLFQYLRGVTVPQKAVEACLEDPTLAIILVHLYKAMY